jgi:hypothetical protein
VKEEEEKAAKAAMEKKGKSVAEKLKKTATIAPGGKGKSP